MKTLIAGAGGLLGHNLVRRYLERGNEVTALVLKSAELQGLKHPRLTIVETDVTRPEQIRGVCGGMNLVISCIGITRIKGRLTHHEVDYQGNLNLLADAERSGVARFGFISPAGTDEGTHVPLLAAKFGFEQALKRSTIPWVIFRAGGFFSDLAEMKKMAAKGPLFVIGDGAKKSTPVDVGDLADVMLQEMDTRSNAIVEVGGPEDLTWQDICRICFEVQNRPVKILRIPVWICRSALPVLRPLSFRNYAMGALLLFMSTRNVCGPKRGKTTLRQFLANAA